MDIEEKQVQVSDQLINCIKFGKGPQVLLFVPPWITTPLVEFHRQFEDFDLEKFTIVSLDMPGCFKSKPPKVFTAECYEKDADYIYELMMLLNIKKFAVLGGCGGAKCAIILAAKHPEVVTKLVVWNVSVRLLPTEWAEFKRLRERFGLDKPKCNTGMPDDLIRTVTALYDYYGEEGTAAMFDKQNDLLRMVMEKQNGNFCSEFLKDIRCPTLVVHGARDTLVDRSNVSIMEAEIADCGTVIIHAAGHVPHKSHYEIFNEKVLQFLLESRNAL